MKIVTYSDFVQNFEAFMSEVSDNNNAITVTINDGNNIVLLPEKKYDNLNKTICMLSTEIDSEYEELKEQLGVENLMETALEATLQHLTKNDPTYNLYTAKTDKADNR